ncbi:MAG: potassium-transporting ATPase potassium-binding subunit [Propionibacteriaceae bacterium]|jgi:K+-transporting ATPase ATPase A chain|nr:potassium-transporting ATPase, subunit [Propionibacteriaceae bacterium]MDX6321378.1 potassium-transporting ATPase potassium-binding subunit [Propionibacteriaceae bacterium]
MSDTVAGLLQVGLLLLLLAACYRPLGAYLAWVFTSERHYRAEKAVYRVLGVDGDTQQSWQTYARAVLAFSAVSVLLLFGMQRAQAALPLSNGLPAVESALAFNTAASFVSNTNWQNYVPEVVMGHLVQMAGLAVQNFVSAAVGIAVAVALVRSFARSQTTLLGNFWVDLVRCCGRVLLPMAVLGTLALVAMGVVQNLSAGHHVISLVGQAQTVPGGPVASQEVIKELGTNGGGFYNANSAHPFENPSPTSNLFTNFLMLVLPVSLTRAFGLMVRDRRQGYALLAVMGTIWGLFLVGATFFETRGSGSVAAAAAGGAMEGKETRFGVWASTLWAISTTGTSTGAVNAAHDSLTPLSGGLALFHMMLGEVTPGGTGSGLYGMLVLAVLAVFVAGLMVGRTPEYLRKKITVREMKLVSLYILTTPALALVGTAIAMGLSTARSSILNPGPHGFSEVLYAFTSAANNNGSAFGGLTGNTPFFNVALGLGMLLGRFVPMILVLALAGSLAQQQPVPVTAGTLPTHRMLFVSMLVGVVLVVTGLTYFPSLTLGPLAEGL